MKIAAITRFKHGTLFQLLRKHGWSQNELARRAGITAHRVGCAINMVNRPSQATIDAIQKAFADVGEFVDVTELFPDAYVGFANAPKHIQFADLTPKQLEDFSTHQKLMLEDAQPPLPSELINTQQALSAFDKILSPRQKDMISARFIDGLTLDEMGKKYGCSGQNINNNLHVALCKIRNYLCQQKKDDDIQKLKVKLFAGKDGIFRPRKEHLEHARDEIFRDWRNDNGAW